MSLNNPHVKLIFRAPANRGFVQGYAGIPEDLARRPSSSASGTVELRTSKPIKAAWLKISLFKVEKLPQQAAGGASYTSDVNGPMTLWEANGDWALLETRDIDFEIPIPIDIPPSTELRYDGGHGAGIWFYLEVTMMEKGKKKGLMRKETIPLSRWKQPIDILTHDLHPAWPIHQVPETLYLMTPSLQIHLTIPASSYGPSDIIQLPITLLLAPSCNLPQITISLIQLSLLEISLFRSSEVESSYPKESYRLVGQRPALISQSRLEVRGEVLRAGEGGGRSWGLMLRIPQGGPGGVGYTVKGGKHLEVRYEMKVEIFGGMRGDEILGVVEKLPVYVDWMSKLESQEEVNKIGYVPALCPSSAPPSVAPPSNKSLNSPSPPYPSPPISSHHNSFTLPVQAPPIAPYTLTPSPPHSPVPFNAARQHQPMGMDRLLAIGTTPSSPSSSEAALGDVAVDYDFPGGWSKDAGAGAGGTRRPSSSTAASRPGSGESAKRPSSFGATARPPMSTHSSTSSVQGQSQQNRISFLVHNPSISVRNDAANGSPNHNGDFVTSPLDLTAPRAPNYSSSPSFSLGSIQETVTPSTSNSTTIGLGRPDAPAAASKPQQQRQQYASAEQEKAQMFARAQATVGRTQDGAFASTTSSSSLANSQPTPRDTTSSSRPSSGASNPTSAAPPPVQKWETAEEEKRRLFEMAKYKVEVTQALAAGLPPPPLPAALLVKPSSQTPTPSSPTPIQASHQPPPSRAAIPTSSTAPSLASSPQPQPQPKYESAEQEKARLFQEAQARVSRVQGQSMSAAQAGGSSGGWGGEAGGSSSNANGTQGASSSSSSGAAPQPYESAEAEKARLGAQREKQNYDEAVARVARTQAAAASGGGSSSNGPGLYDSAEDERARRALEKEREQRLHDEALVRAGTRNASGSRLSIHQPNGHRSVSSPSHRTSLSLHSPPPPASLSGHDRISSPPPHPPPTSFYNASINASSSNGALSSSSNSSSPQPNGRAVAYPSAEEEKAKMRYQDAVSARDRVVSGGSASSSSSGMRRSETMGGGGGGGGIPPPTVSTIHEDPIPYEDLYGPGPSLTSSAAAASSSSSSVALPPPTTARPRPSLPPGAGSGLDEKEQMKRFYAAQEAVARATGTSIPVLGASSSSSSSSPYQSPPPPSSPQPNNNNDRTPILSFSSPALSSYQPQPSYAAPHEPKVVLTAQEEKALFRQRDLAAAQTLAREASVSPPLARDPTISQGKQRGPPISRPSSSTSSSAGLAPPPTFGGARVGGAPPPLPPKPPSDYAAKYVSLGPGPAPVPWSPGGGTGGGGDAGEGGVMRSMAFSPFQVEVPGGSGGSGSGGSGRS